MAEDSQEVQQAKSEVPEYSTCNIINTTARDVVLYDFNKKPIYLPAGGGRGIARDTTAVQDR